MVCIHPINIQGRTLPCGRCPACRIQKTNEWTTRLLHEMQYYENSIFLTLTYNDDSLPESMELVPADLRNFWKRLRKNIDVKIKYFACGEYGTIFRRPHYHAIVFGLSNKDYDAIDDAWDLGFIKIGSVTEQSIRYVASYIMDKDESINMSEFTGIKVAPFSRSSNGLGKRYVLDNKERLIKNLSIKRKNIELGLPKYYKKLIEDDVSDKAWNDQAIIKSEKTRNKLAQLGIEPIMKAQHDIDFRKQKAEELKFLKARRDEKRSL